MGVYGDPKKKVRGPSDFLFWVCSICLAVIFLGWVFLVYKAFFL